MSETVKPLLQSGVDYFDELVKSGIEARGFTVSQTVVKYLADMLSFYIDARNLYEPAVDESGKRNPQTLAELWLTAQTAEPTTQKELLKKLGDRTLYISGFFSESLNRSLVDVDYYYSMGTAAYRSLAHFNDKDQAAVFSEMSDRFLDLVEVFNVISHDTFSRTDQGILRLYETYLRTGSPLAKERLQEFGVLVCNETSLKKVSGH